jgi:hypothetical protein
MNTDGSIDFEDANHTVTDREAVPDRFASQSDVEGLDPVLKGHDLLEDDGTGGGNDENPVREIPHGFRHYVHVALSHAREVLVPSWPPTRLDIVQYTVEAIGLVIVFVLMFTVVPPETRVLLWWLPLVGVAGATISMSTPAGGGVLYFPALNVAGRPVENAVVCTTTTTIDIH